MNREPPSTPWVSAFPEISILSDRYCALRYNRQTFIMLKVDTDFVLLLTISLMLLSFFLCGCGKYCSSRLIATLYLWRRRIRSRTQMILTYCKSYEGHSKIRNDVPVTCWNQDSKSFTIFEVYFLHNKFRSPLIFIMSASTSQLFNWSPHMDVFHISAPRDSDDYTLGPRLRLVWTFYEDENIATLKMMRMIMSMWVWGLNGLINIVLIVVW